MRRTLRLFNLRLSQLSFRLEHWVQLFFLLLVTLLVTLLLRDQSTVMYWLNKSCEAVVCNLPRRQTVINFFRHFLVVPAFRQLSPSWMLVRLFYCHKHFLPSLSWMLVRRAVSSDWTQLRKLLQLRDWESAGRRGSGHHLQPFLLLRKKILPTKVAIFVVNCMINICKDEKNGTGEM